MKNFTLYVSFIFCSFFITSCQKTDADKSSGLSAGTLKADSSLDCLPASINGQYTTDSILTAANFIDVHVNVSLAGTYLIKSGSVNGYSFKGSGTVGALGINTIRLYASGTPIHAGTDQFIIQYGTSFCVIDVPVAQAGDDATYTFAGAGSTCSGAVLNGAYVNGETLDATNTVAIAVQITAPGNFLISTTELNGVTFSASGVFTDISQSTVSLNGHGTSLSAGTFNFPLIGNGTSCAFSITFL